MQDAFVKAGAKLPTKLVRKARVRQRWGQASNNQSIRWVHGWFGRLDIFVEGWNLGETKQVGPNTWVPIEPKNRRPEQISIGFSGALQDGVNVLYAAAGEVTDMMTRDAFPPFVIEILWQGMPRTRQKNKDNIDIVLWRSGGHFVQLQISAVVRNGKFWLCVQEIFDGRVASTSAQKAEELRLAMHQMGEHTFVVIPTAKENAYPGANYLWTFKNMGPKVVTHITSMNSVAQLSEVRVAEWDPQWIEPEDVPEYMTKDGWLRAVVTFFNLVIGWGFARNEAGEMVFVHFANVLEEDSQPLAKLGEMPVLEPMMGIVYKMVPDLDRDGNPKLNDDGSTKMKALVRAP